jgi:hypothetical protein
MAGKKRLRGNELVEHVLERLSERQWLIESAVQEAFRKHADLARPRLLDAVRSPTTSPDVRLNASLYLLHIGDPAFWEGFSCLLAVPEADARYKAADALAKAFPDELSENAMRSPAARAGLSVLLDDSDPRIREIAPRLCEKARIPDLDVRLRRMLRGDPEPFPRLSAALLLGWEGRDPDALEALIGSLDEPVLAARRQRFVGVSDVWVFGEPGKILEFARKWRLPLQPEREWRPEPGPR